MKHRQADDPVTAAPFSPIVITNVNKQEAAQYFILTVSAQQQQGRQRCATESLCARAPINRS